IGGARALGFDDIGVIAKGNAADLVLIDLASGPFVPLRNPINQMVYAESGGAVRSVFVAGRLVYENGTFLGFDYPAVVAAAQALADEIDAATRPAAGFVARLEPFVTSF